MLRMVLLFVITAAAVCCDGAWAQQPRTIAFEDPSSGLAFLYASDWRLERLQRPAAAHFALKADDGSGAVCVMTVGNRGADIPPDGQIRQALITDHEGFVSEMVEHGYRRQRFGSSTGVASDYSGITRAGSLLVRGTKGALFTGRHLLIVHCYQPMPVRTMKPPSATKMFSQIASTVRFRGS